jgi:ribosomal protein S12 methylthiotransferase accessory factor
MTVPPAVKVHFSGTHRVRDPAETWDLVSPLMGDYGVTRVADVTGLDVIGIPVWLAVRPLAATLAVSQGKGATNLHAKVSALMEAIELWHAESAPLPVARSATAAADLRLPYDLLELDQYPGSMLTERSRLDWVAGRGLISAAPVLVPLDAVSLAPEAIPPTGGGPGRVTGAAHEPGLAWRPLGITRSSNGLASGNCLVEAALHALYEVIERDALSELGTVRSGGRVAVQPRSVTAECGDLIERVLNAGAYLDIWLLPNRMRIPCFSCRIWSPEFPLLAEGSGAHSSAEVALSRAVTEAAQGRLTAITASRDDIGLLYDTLRVGIVAEPQPPADQVAWHDLSLTSQPRFDVIDDELAWLAQEVQVVTGSEPLLVDLSTRAEFAVTRVVAPGLRQA